MPETYLRKHKLSENWIKLLTQLEPRSMRGAGDGWENGGKDEDGQMMAKSDGWFPSSCPDDGWIGAGEEPRPPSLGCRSAVPLQSLWSSTPARWSPSFRYLAVRLWRRTWCLPLPLPSRLSHRKPDLQVIMNVVRILVVLLHKNLLIDTHNTLA